MIKRASVAVSAAIAGLLLFPAGAVTAPQASAESAEAPGLLLVHGFGGGAGPGAGYQHGRNDPDWHRQMHEWMERHGAGQGHHMGHGMMGHGMMGHGMMGPGMMGPGMMGPGMMGPGMMGPGMMGPGMMGPGMMGPGMMGPGPHMDPGMMGRGMMGPGMMYGSPQGTAAEITTDNVRAMLEQRVANNPNLRVGTVAEEDGAIVAEIVTKEGSLVNRFRIDPDTGAWAPAN